MARSEGDAAKARRETGLAAFGLGADAGAPGPGPAAPEPLSVSQVVAEAKRVLGSTRALQDVPVRGEISGFKAYGSSGHWYFTLKDDESQLRCAMFRGQNFRVKFRPEDGMAVVARGSVGVYQPRGEMNFVVSAIEPEGAGALAVALEQLKRRLEEEGLFAPERKRALPILPRTIGVVTSAQGAVWHDIQKVARRRFPGIHLVLAPVRVQGEGAAEEVAAAIARFNLHRAADVLIVGRGGGSMEDLWAFNEEVVVRAIAGSTIPVVSAVGHETDWTLADAAADLRAATPSQAAEFCVPEAFTLLSALDEAKARMRRALQSRVTLARSRFDSLAASPTLARPERWLAERRQRVDEASARLEQAARLTMEAKRAALREAAASLNALSPLATLARGYAVARRAVDGRALRRAEEAALDDLIEVVLAEGRVEAKVTKVEARARSTEESR